MYASKREHKTLSVSLRKAVATLLFDILVALLITAVAVVLGITVHPLLFLILVLAVVWLFARRSGSRHLV